MLEPESLRNVHIWSTYITKYHLYILILIRILYIIINEEFRKLQGSIIHLLTI